VVVRQQIARLYAERLVRDWTHARSTAATEAGKEPGPEASVAKLANTRLTRLERDVASLIAGTSATLEGGDAPLGGGVTRLILWSPVTSIAGGTDEVQHNIVGERALGLPKEPQVDRDRPFRQVRVAT
jgi:alkylation response protein AidB-like acyl-CoA dehydrogenase